MNWGKLFSYIYTGIITYGVLVMVIQVIDWLIEIWKEKK